MQAFKRLIASALTLLILTLQLTGCATNYEGPGPNFALRGEEAKAEIQNFKMNPDYFYHSPHAYQMGDEGSPYWASSLDPIVKSVSPAAGKKLDHAKLWDYANFGFLIASLVVAFSKPGPSGEVAYFSLLGLAIGSGIGANILVGQAIEQYNRALPTKFAAEAGLSVSY